MRNSNKISRCAFAILAGIAAGFSGMSQPAIIRSIKESKPLVYTAGGNITRAVTVDRIWKNGFCGLQLRNTGKTDLRLSEVVLFQANRLFSGHTTFYAEGFQMLSQYKGTLEKIQKVGGYDDNAHYKLPQSAGYKTVYNMLLLHGEGGNEILMGFNSSFRYIGKFYLSADTIKVVMDLDNTLIKAGATLALEEFSLLSSKNTNQLTASFAARINHFHPRLRQQRIPAGWCSWYCFGPEVTAENIKDNLAYIKKTFPNYDTYSWTMATRRTWVIGWIPGVLLAQTLKPSCSRSKQAVLNPLYGLPLLYATAIPIFLNNTPTGWCTIHRANRSGAIK